MKRLITPFVGVSPVFGPAADELARFVQAGQAAQHAVDQLGAGRPAAPEPVATAKPEPRPVDLVVYGLTLAQAYALAELCKRIGWSDVRSLAVNDAEAHLMIGATDRLRGALEQEGVSVR